MKAGDIVKDLATSIRGGQAANDVRISRRLLSRGMKEALGKAEGFLK